MYTQAMDTMGKDAKPKVVRSAEELAREEKFEARIAAGEFIEPKDAMPELQLDALIWRAFTSSVTESHGTKRAPLRITRGRVTPATGRHATDER